MQNSNENDEFLCEDFKLKNAFNLKDFENGAVFELDSTTEEGASSKDSNPVLKEEESLRQEWCDNYDEGLLNALSGLSNTKRKSCDDKHDSSLSDNEDDHEPFDILARKMEDISGDEGVLKMELQSGVGPEIPEGSQVTFHYSAFLEYADEPFDSSVLRKQPQKAYLNVNDTLKGLKIGLRSMRKREKARFLVRPEYAYGKMGCPPRIPMGAVILYDVTLLNWVDRSGADALESLDAEEKPVSFEQKMKAARDYHREGNDFYKAKQLTKAKSSYKKASWILENALAANKEEEEKQTELLFRMHSNLAQVNLDLMEPAKACSDCRFAFEIPAKVSDELKAKLYFRYAKAKMYLADFDISRKYLLKAQRLRPNNPDIPNLLEEVLKRVAKYDEREKIICRKMFGMGLSSKKKQDENPISPIDIDVQEALKTLLNNFERNKERKELPLSPNLTEAELGFVETLTKDLKLKLEKHYIGTSVLWRIVRI